MAYSRFDFTQWGTGLDSQGLPRDATKVMDFYRQVAANPSTPYAQGILQGIQAYAKNNPGSTSDPMWVTNALDWYWRDIQRKSQKAPSMFGPLDSILKPAITLGAGLINPALGAVVGGGLGAANDGGIIGGLLGAAGGYTGGSALKGAASAFSNAGGWSTLMNAPGTFASNLGRGALTSLQNYLPGYGGSLTGAGGGAAALALKGGTTALQALGGTGGAGTAGGSGLKSTLLAAAPQLVGAGLSYASGSGSDAYDQQLIAARNAEARRQATRDANAAAVSATMNNQDDYYRRLRSNVFDYQKSALDERKADESRELKFELARRGHLGGSQEVDAIGDLTRLYQQGLLKAGTLADDTVNYTRASDQNAKQQALLSVLNDADANQAIQSAVNQSQLASQQALDAAKGQNLGDVFTGLGYLYQQGQQANERRRATVDYYARRGTGGSVGPASSYSGSVNRKVA